VNDWLAHVSTALERAPLVSLGAALLLGAASVVVSPCHLANGQASDNAAGRGGATERFLDSHGATRAVAFFRKGTGVALIFGGLFFLYSMR
jgi:hypothetical protein